MQAAALAPQAPAAVRPAPASQAAMSGAAAAGAKSASAPSGYPPSMRDYVHRAYMTCMSDPARKDRVSSELKGIIEECDR